MAPAKSAGVSVWLITEAMLLAPVRLSIALAIDLAR
jgi:hypothetical protein